MCFWFGLRLRERGLKASIVGVIHEVLTEVREPKYVGVLKSGQQEMLNLECVKNRMSKNSMSKNSNLASEVIGHLG